MPDLDLDLDRKASLCRAAVAPSKRGAVGPFSFLLVTLVVAIVFSAILVLVGYELSQVRIGPQLISKGAVVPVPAKAVAKATALPTPVVMPNGSGAFGK